MDNIIFVVVVVVHRDEMIDHETRMIEKHDAALDCYSFKFLLKKKMWADYSSYITESAVNGVFPTDSFLSSSSKLQFANFLCKQNKD